MNDYPFIEACYKKPAKHIPVWYMRQAGRCLPEYRKLKEKYDILTLARTPALATEVSLMPIKRFGVDAAILFADIMLPLIGMGVDLDIVEKIGPVIKNPIRTMEDVQKLKVLTEAQDFKYLDETIANLKKELSRMTPAVPLIGFSGAPFTLASYLIEGKPSRDFALTKKMMHEEPDSWRFLMRVLTDSILFYLKVQVEAGIEAVQLFDSWVGCLSKDDYVKYVLPFSEEIFKGLKYANIPRIHFAVDTTAFLKEFASVDCEVVGIDWRISIPDAWKIIGENKAIQGNLDPATLLCDFEVIKKEVDKIIDSLPKREGFIFNLGHGVLPDTPYETIIKLTEYIHGK